MTWLRDSNTKLNQPTVSSPIEPVVSRIDDHIFHDDSIDYSHIDRDIKEDPEGLIYLTIDYRNIALRAARFSTSEEYIELNKADVVALAKEFGLTGLDLSC